MPRCGCGDGIRNGWKHGSIGMSPGCGYGSNNKKEPRANAEGGAQKVGQLVMYDLPPWNPSERFDNKPSS